MPKTPPPKTSRVLRTLIEIAGALAVTVALIFALEGGASALLFARDIANTSAPNPLLRPRTTADTLLGWRNQSNADLPDAYGTGVGLHTDARGFRQMTPRDSTKAPNTKTVICSGDSYTFGVGVADDHTWCSLLPQIAPKMQTINMGQDYFGLDQAYLLYRREAPATPHSVQILAVTMPSLERATSDNDAGWRKPTFEVIDGRLERRDAAAMTSAQYRRSEMARILASLRVVQTLRTFPSFDPDVEKTRSVDDRRPVFEQMISELQAAHRAAGTQLVLLYLPTNRDSRAGSGDERRAWLAGVAKQQGVPLVDLTPSLRAMSKDSLDAVYIARWTPVRPPGATGQLSNIGHAWVARALAEQLSPLLAAGK